MIPFIIQPRENNSSRSSNSSSLKDTNDRKGKTNSNINSIFRKCSSGSCGVGDVGVGMNSGIEHHSKLGEANPTFSTIWGGEEESSIVFLRECDDFETKAKTKRKAIDTTLLELELNPTFSTVWAEDCDSYASTNDYNDLEMQQDEQEQEQQLDQKEEVSSGSSWTSTTSSNDNSSKQLSCHEQSNSDDISSLWCWSVVIVIVIVLVVAIAAVVLYVFISM